MPWRRRFGVLTGIALVVIVKDSPYADHHRDELRLRALGRTLRAAWLVPGTRLGLWSHFTSQFAANMFTMLWGFPFLVSGQGLSRTRPRASCSWLMVVTSMVSSPVIGTLDRCATPSRAAPSCCGSSWRRIAAWTAVLLWPGRAPLWLLVVLVVLIAIGGPGSMIGFDIARTFNPPTRIGSASGIVNTGGFLATLAAVALVGVVLDRVAPAGPSTWDVDAFRAAMTVQYPVWALGSCRSCAIGARLGAPLSRPTPRPMPRCAPAATSPSTDVSGRDRKGHNRNTPGTSEVTRVATGGVARRRACCRGANLRRRRP